MLKLWYLAAASLGVGVLWQHGVVSGPSRTETDTSQTDDTSLTDETTQIDDMLLTEETTQIDDTLLTDETTQIDDMLLTDETTQIDDMLLTDETTQIDDMLLTDETTQIDDMLLTDETTQIDDTSPTDETTQIDDMLLTEETTEIDDTSPTGDTMTDATTLIDATLPLDDTTETDVNTTTLRTTTVMPSTTTTPADRRTTRGRFTITDMDISEITAGFNVSVIEEIHSVCAKNDEIGWCLVVWIMYLPGSVRVEFHLSVRETVTDQEFFDAMEQAIENDEFLSDLTIDPDSLEFGDSGPKEEWTTTQIAVAAVLGGLCVIAIVMSTVAIVLFTRRKKGLSTTDAADTSVTNLLMGSRRNSYESSRAGASAESRPNQYEITDSLTSSHDSGMAVDRMVVIQGAMDKAPDIDWSAMKNFKMKNGGSSYDNPIYDTGNEDETVFPAVQTTF